MKNFSPGVGKDNYTITFPQHPCVILNALEVLDFHVISSAPKMVNKGSTPTINGHTPPLTNQPEQSIVWTLRKDFERYI